jgi:hypothetical protein
MCGGGSSVDENGTKERGIIGCDIDVDDCV